MRSPEMLLGSNERITVLIGNAWLPRSSFDRNWMGIINKYRKDNNAETLFPSLHKQGSLVMLSRLLIISSTTQVKPDQKNSLTYRVERFDMLLNLKIEVGYLNYIYFQRCLSLKKNNHKSHVIIVCHLKTLVQYESAIYFRSNWFT